MTAKNSSANANTDVAAMNDLKTENVELRKQVAELTGKNEDQVTELKVAELKVRQLSQANSQLNLQLLDLNARAALREVEEQEKAEREARGDGVPFSEAQPEPEKSVK